MEKPAAPGQLCMQLPVGHAASRLAWGVAALAALPGATWVVVAAKDLYPSEPAAAVAGAAFFPLLALFCAYRALQLLLNRHRLEVRDERLLVRTGPFPAWSQRALALEWISDVHVDWTDDEHEEPGLDFKLQNGRTETVPLMGCAHGELEFAAVQVKATLAPARPAKAS